MDYGLIGNCKSCALVRSDSSIEWFCYLTSDSASAFAKLVDEKIGGYMQIIPNQNCKITQS